MSSPGPEAGGVQLSVRALVTQRVGADPLLGRPRAGGCACARELFTEGWVTLGEGQSASAAPCQEGHQSLGAVRRLP